VVDDTQETHDWTPWCEVSLGGGDVPPPSSGGVVFEPNDNQANAAALTAGNHDADFCDNDPSDWYAIESNGGELKVSVSFSHDAGDIDVQLYDGTSVLSSSTSTDDFESVDASVSAGTYHVRVFQYGGQTACQSYQLEVSVD
jgi:hypothetical protein